MKVRQQSDMMGLEDILGSEDVNVDGMEDVYDIDVEEISQNANILATGTIQNLARLYNNKQFIEEHPEFKKRVDSEIETLRLHYKMAKTNETVHDHLVQAIANNPSNASLYQALTKLQANMMSIEKEIHEIITRFNNMCTSYQTEMNFNTDDEEVGATKEDKDGGVTARGSKSFITDMNKEDVE